MTLYSFIFSFFLYSTMVMAFAQTAQIKGIVKDCNTDEKIENAKITLSKFYKDGIGDRTIAGYALVAEVYTNKAGEFIFNNIHEGQYEIVCEKKINGKTVNAQPLNSSNVIYIIKGQPSGSILILKPDSTEADNLAYVEIETVDFCLKTSKTSQNIKTKENPHCPICKKDDQVVPIIYGKPATTLIKKAQKGEVHLGGCKVSKDSPKWYCKTDRHRF